MRPCKAILSVYNNHPPLTFAALYNCDQQQKTEWHVPGWKISPVYKTKKANNEHTG